MGEINILDSDNFVADLVLGFPNLTEATLSYARFQTVLVDNLAWVKGLAVGLKVELVPVLDEVEVVVVQR